MALARKTLDKRKNLKEEQRREQLKQAAITVFSAKGYQSATLDDLVMEAGVSKSLLYWYWESKAALLSELIDSCMALYTNMLQEALKVDAPFDERIRSLLWDFMSLSRDNEKLNRLVYFCSLHHSNKAGENFGEQVNAHFGEVLRLLEEFLRQGRKDGLIRKDLDLTSVALSLLCFIQGHIYMSILGDRLPLERILPQWLEEFSELAIPRS